MHYAEVFTSYQDNAMPFVRRPLPEGIRPDHETTAGIHYSINYLTPYWDPDTGFRTDITYQGGVAEMDRQVARRGHRQDDDLGHQGAAGQR